MSDGTKTHSIPRQIEPRKFAHHGISLSGHVPAADMSRLAEIATAADINVDLSFSLGEQRERLVTGRVHAPIQMQCQRCLQAVDIDVECEVSLAVVRTEDQAKGLSSIYEPWIVEEEEADLYAIIEEEILLNVPLVALHNEPCSDAVQLTQTSSVEEPEKTGKINPFQVLLQLKDTTKKPL